MSTTETVDTTAQETETTTSGAQEQTQTPQEIRAQRLDAFRQEFKQMTDEQKSSRLQELVQEEASLQEKLRSNEFELDLRQGKAWNAFKYFMYNLATWNKIEEAGGIKYAAELFVGLPKGAPVKQALHKTSGYMIKFIHMLMSNVAADRRVGVESANVIVNMSELIYDSFYQVVDIEQQLQDISLMIRSLEQNVEIDEVLNQDMASQFQNMMQPQGIEQEQPTQAKQEDEILVSE